MTLKSILCVSWNLELQCPDDNALRNSFVDYITSLDDDKRPNLIAIGLQETASYNKHGRGTFIGNKLVSAGLLGNRGLLDNNPYQLIGTVRFKGMTKWTQAFGKKAQQCLQILVRRKDVPHAESFLEQHQKAPRREKGFCYAEMVFYDKRLCFISTHLDSGKSDEREKECREIRRTILEHVKKNGRYHAAFMMGDLNYRLNAGKIHNNVTMQHHMYVSSDFSSNKKKWTKICGMGGMIEKLRSKDGRDFVRVNCDSFDKDDFSMLPFIWPDFKDGSFPTYKRTKSSKKYSEIRKLKNKESRTVSKELITTIYAKDEKFSIKRGNSWDVGWLDRIGFAFKPRRRNPDSCTLEGIKMIARGVTHANPSSVKIGSWPYVPYGDHVPVYCHLELEGFEKSIDAAQIYNKVVIQRAPRYRKRSASSLTQVERDVALWYGALTKAGGEEWKKGMLKRLFAVITYGGLMVHRDKGWRPWQTFRQPICTSISHTARILISMPPGREGRDFWDWLWGRRGREAIRPRSRLMATHGISGCKRKCISRRYEVFKEVKETKGPLAGLGIVFDHYGVNIPLGGYGNRNPISGQIIDETGEHGHLYIAYGKNKLKRHERRAILIGVEQSAPWDRYGEDRENFSLVSNIRRVKRSKEIYEEGIPDQYGGKHGAGGHSRYSATGGDDFSYNDVKSSLSGIGPSRGNYIDGMFIDLTKERFEYVKTKDFTPDKLSSFGVPPMTKRIWLRYKQRHNL